MRRPAALMRINLRTARKGITVNAVAHVPHDVLDMIKRDIPAPP